MAHFSLGIDLHKKFAYWTLLNPDREVLWQGKVLTKDKETKEALAQLPMAPADCAAVIEPIESWGWYAELLESQGLSVTLANPLQVGLIAKSRLKHDKVDSKILAELLHTGYLPTAYLAPREVRDLRELLRTHISLVCMRTRLKNRIIGIFAKHGLQAPATDLFGKKGMAWMQEQKLRPVYQVEVDAFLHTLVTIKQELLVVDKEIKRRAAADPETQILATIPGVGTLVSLLIKAEVGSFERFGTPAQLAAFAGLVSSSYSSAGKLRFGKITKQGSKYLRWGMVQAAQHANPSWGRLWKFYQKIKMKKNNKIARVALARKLLVIAWYLIKRKNPFGFFRLGSLAA